MVRKVIGHSGEHSEKYFLIVMMSKGLRRISYIITVFTSSLPLSPLQLFPCPSLYITHSNLGSLLSDCYDICMYMYMSYIEDTISQLTSWSSGSSNLPMIFLGLTCNSCVVDISIQGRRHMTSVLCLLTSWRCL